MRCMRRLKSRVVALSALILAIAALIGTTRVAVDALPTSEGSANALVARWLTAMADPAGDRGWSYLSVEAQQDIYGGDRNAYLADVRGVDWSAVSWEDPVGRIDDGVAYIGNVGLRSHPGTVPRFLLEKRLVGPSCVDDLPFGISVIMSVGWFTDPHPSAGAGPTGSAGDCLDAFDAAAGPPHDAFDAVGLAWGSPGPNQRVGVKDSSGLVAAIGAGRQDPPLSGSIVVSEWEPRQIAIAWRGSACDANTTLHVGGSASDVVVVVERLNGDEPCSGTGVTYEVILELRAEISIDDVSAEVRP